MVACLLVRVGHEVTTDVLYAPEKFFGLEERLPLELNSNRLKPVLATLYDSLAVYCSSANYCRKLHYRDPEVKPEYFARFRSVPPVESKDDRFLVMNSIKDECQLGLLDAETYCPLAEDLPDDDLAREQVKEKLAFAELVLDRRIAELDSSK